MIVCYCLDENYIEYAEISIQSVKKFNPQAHVIVVSEQPIRVKGADEYHIIKLPKIFRNRGIGDRITNTAYLKCFLTDLPYNKIIYLDGDTICQWPFKELWNMDCEYICLTESHNFGLKQAQAIGVEKYGLTGMMLMNLKNLRNINFEGKCLEVENTYPTPETGWQHDETCINVALKNKLTFIPVEWNYCINRTYKNPIREIDAKILHYVGRQKELMVKQYDGMGRLLKDINGKSVAIVGNAKSIFDKHNGNEIDKHDFIIRFNKGFIELPSSQGTQTTMVMLGTTIPRWRVQQYNAKWVINRSNKYDNFVDYIVPNIDRKRMRDKLEAQPSTGFMAIDICLTAQAKQIDLYGFDFEKTKTYYNEDSYITQHKYSEEEKIVLEYQRNGLLTIY